jgi:hypothetical protein
VRTPEPKAAMSSIRATPPIGRRAYRLNASGWPWVPGRFADRAITVTHAPPYKCRTEEQHPRCRQTGKGSHDGIGRPCRNDSKKWRSPDNPHARDSQQHNDGHHDRHHHCRPLPVLTHVEHHNRAGRISRREAAAAGAPAASSMRVLHKVHAEHDARSGHPNQDGDDEDLAIVHAEEDSKRPATGGQLWAGLCRRVSRDGDVMFNPLVQTARFGLHRLRPPVVHCNAIRGFRLPAPRRQIIRSDDPSVAPLGEPDHRVRKGRPARLAPAEMDG